MSKKFIMDYDKFKQSLQESNYNEQEIEKIMSLVPNEIKIINPQEGSFGDVITNILNIPAMQDVVKAFVAADEKKEITISQRENDFHSFLKRIDITQKIYNLLSVSITCYIVYQLKSNDIIGKETAQTIIVFIIGLSMQDAISSFFKSSSPKD